MVPRSGLRRGSADFTSLTQVQPELGGLGPREV